MMEFYLKREVEAAVGDVRSMIVRALSEDGARKMANDECHDEGRIWTDPEQVSCTRIVHCHIQSGILHKDITG